MGVESEWGVAERRGGRGPGGDGAQVGRLAGLLGETAGGDRSAFTQFYRETSPRVFGLALRIVRANSVAEEVTQEVYLHVWRRAGDYQQELASPMGWLMMLAHRRAVDRVRSEQTTQKREAAYGHRQLGRDHDVVVEEVEQRLDERLVSDCLAGLSSVQREAIALAYYSGRTYSEVADYLQIPLPTVKTRIRDGLQRLRQCLGGGSR